jgi:hypothetical protein
MFYTRQVEKCFYSKIKIQKKSNTNPLDDGGEEERVLAPSSVDHGLEKGLSNSFLEKLLQGDVFLGKP